MEHVEAALVGSKAGAPGGHAAEGPGRDLAVRVTAPRAAPMLHLDDLDRRFANEGLDDVLVGQVVGALDGVEGVALVRVFGPQRRRSAAFGRHGMAAHRVAFGAHPDLAPGFGPPRSYRCPGAGEPPADDQDVVAL